jgi:radical SAM protein with 4Fe4S-binding SPASM domain
VKITDRVYLNQDQEFQWPDLKEVEDDGVGFCYGLRNQIAILVDGTVVPCCLDGEGVVNLGNINTTQFSKIIESERAGNIIEGFSRREAVEELCRKCGYRKRFGK